MPAPSRVLLLTRRGCHLCVEAEAALRDALTHSAARDMTDDWIAALPLKEN